MEKFNKLECYRCFDNNKFETKLILCQVCNKYCCINCASLACDTCQLYFDCYPCSFNRRRGLYICKKRCNKCIISYSTVTVYK